MANVDVLNLNGDKVGSIELSDALFAPEQVNEALLWEAVKHYRAGLRQGTHKTKSRSEVAGSGTVDPLKASKKAMGKKK